MGAAPDRACPQPQPVPTCKALPAAVRARDKTKTKIAIWTQTLPKLQCRLATVNQTRTALSYRDINSSERRLQDSKFTAIHTFNFPMERYFENSCCWAALWYGGVGDLRLQHEEEPTKLLTLQHKPLQQISVPRIYSGWQDFCFAEAVPYGQSGLPYWWAKAEGRQMLLASICLNFPLSLR